MEYAGPDEVANDSKCRVALARAGYGAVTVTWAQVRDARELDEIVHVRAKQLRRRRGIPCSDWLSRRYALKYRVVPSRLSGVSW